MLDLLKIRTACSIEKTSDAKLLLLKRHEGGAPTTTGLHNEAEQLICKACGRAYIVRKCEVQYAHTDSYLNYCVSCQKAFHARRKKEQEDRANREWQQKKLRIRKFLRICCHYGMCGI